MIAYFPDTQVDMTQGELSTYEHRSDETNRWLRMQFCPRCGTTISHTAEVRPGFRGIAAGTFDNPDWFKIERHIWTRSARPWVTIPRDVAAFEKAFQPKSQ